MSRPGDPPRPPGAGGSPGTGPAAAHPPKDPGKVPAGASPAFHCDLCGAAMLGRHCKLVCPDCGYMRDCSDP